MKRAQIPVTTVGRCNYLPGAICFWPTSKKEEDFHRLLEYAWTDLENSFSISKGIIPKWFYGYQVRIGIWDGEIEGRSDLRILYSSYFPSANAIMTLVIKSGSDYNTPYSLKFRG